MWEYMIFEKSVLGKPKNIEGGQNKFFADILESLPLIEAMNKAGNNGWELVMVIPESGGLLYYQGEKYVFKKQIS